MQKRKIRSKRLIAGLLVMLMLAGCSGQGGAVSSDVTPSTDGATTTTTETTTVPSVTSTTPSSAAANTTTQVAPAGVSKTNRTSTTTKVTTTTTKRRKPVDLSMFPVKETMPIEEAAAKVNNTLSAPMTKIKSESSLVREYDPNYTLSMHGGLAIFKGKLYASYSRHPQDEDGAGQHVVISSTPLDDFGNWSKPKIIGPAGVHSDGIHQASCVNGWLHTDGEKLYAFYSSKEYPASAWSSDGAYLPSTYDAVWTHMCTFTSDGVNWCEPFEVPASAANESARLSLTGQWFGGSGNKLRYSDEETPTIIWETVGPTAAQIEDAINRGAGHLPESSWYQTDDYVLHHMIRSSSGYVWMSNSYDNGKTWTDVYQTNFKSDDHMPNFGRLPDGRCYFVGTTAGDNLRMPLQLYISEDGYNFDTGYILRDEEYVLQTPGYAKTGGFSYPEVLFDDTYMYILYAKQKEVMEVTRVKLTDIK